MTHTIPPGSPKAVKALAFGREMVKAMRARDIPLKEVAKAAGVGHTALDHYRTGSILPKTATGLAIADVLDWPKLARIIEAARTFVCARPGCGRTYRHEGGSPRKYCTPSCAKQAAVQRIASTRLRQAGQTGDGRHRAAAIARLRSAARIADERAVVAETAIAAYCRECEPEGLCRVADCPLRALSPLPLATREGTGQTRTRAQIRAELNRKAAPAKSASMTKRWADPDYRERQGTALRAAVARETPEQRAARGRAVAASKAARSPEQRTREHRQAGETRRRNREEAIA